MCFDIYNATSSYVVYSSSGANGYLAEGSCDDVIDGWNEKSSTLDFIKDFCDVDDKTIEAIADKDLGFHLNDVCDIEFADGSFAQLHLTIGSDLSRFTEYESDVGTFADDFSKEFMRLRNDGWEHYGALAYCGVYFDED